MTEAREVHTLLSGLAFGESPRWHEGRLWFSNWTAQEIIAVDLTSKSEVAVRLPFAAFPFSIDWLPDGRLLIVSASERPLLRREADGSLMTYADLSGLSTRVWNEIVLDGRGSAYINGGSFDAPSGIVALVRPDGSARQVADEIAFPNGMLVTPDNSTLIIAESHAQRLTAFDIDADGSLSHRRVWAELPGGAPDGICMDAEGAVWVADVPNQHCVRVREGGQVLQTVEVDRGCFACMLGGVEGKTLFIMAAKWPGFENMLNAPRTGQVLTVQAPAPAAGRP